MISRNDTEKIASLARLQFTESELDKLTGELNDVLGYIDQLNEVDVTNVSPLENINESVETNVVRSDETAECLSQEDALKNAPKAADGYFLVPKVIEQTVDQHNVFTLDNPFYIRGSFQKPIIGEKVNAIKANSLAEWARCFWPDLVVVSRRKNDPVKNNMPLKNFQIPNDFGVYKLNGTDIKKKKDYDGVIEVSIKISEISNITAQAKSVVQRLKTYWDKYKEFPLDDNY